jgi:hypothetical protein
LANLKEKSSRATSEFSVIDEKLSSPIVVSYSNLLARIKTLAAT